MSQSIHPADYGSFIVDGRGTVVGFNETMELLTGWPAAEVVGHSKDQALAYDLEGHDPAAIHEHYRER